jgi:hypothetical protein
MPAHLEYKLEALSLEVDKLADYLNEQSKNGWEFVTVLEVQAGGSMHRLIFRRELTNPTWDQPGDDSGAIPEPSPENGGPQSPPA